jgi:hypothetical protein
MTVIPLPVMAERRLTARLTARRPQTSPPAPRAAVVREVDAVEAAAPPETQLQVEISGTFTSPTGRVGTMTGQARVRQIRVDEEHVRATVVFTGRLCDADGSAIGTGSRRATAPAATAEGPHGRAAVIGPVEVDLLGLAVSIRPFVVGVDVWSSE